MARFDYGYILLRDGKLIDCTDNHMFMEVSDVEVTPVEDAYDYYNKCHGISGNYFAYVGDENLMLCFYKTHIKLVRGDRVLGTIYCGQYSEKYPDDRNVYYSTMPIETLYNPFNCGIDIKIDLLDRNYYLMDCGTVRDDGLTFWEYYKKCIGLENERTSAYTEREHKKFLKNMRARKVLEKIYKGRDLWELPDAYVNNDQSHKFDVTFTLNGFEYEIIFGYGIKGFKEHYPISYTAQEVWSLICADPNATIPKYPNWW
jgi:hypothetical protein